MNNSVIKYSRGSIWWCKKDIRYTNKSGILDKSRPCLIISNNQRGTSSIVEILKITSQDKSNVCSSINIPIMLNNRTNYILCNQHDTVSTDDLFNYEGQVSSEVMKQVEYGILRCQGMEDLISLQSKYCDLKDIVNNIADERLKLYKDIDVGSEISKIITGLSEMINTAETNLISEANRSLDQENKSVTNEDMTVEESRQRKGFKKSTRTLWTNSTMKEFLNDRLKMTVTEVAAKWNIKPSSVGTYVGLFRKKLNEVSD